MTRRSVLCEPLQEELCSSASPRCEVSWGDPGGEGRPAVLNGVSSEEGTWKEAEQ